MRRGISLLEVLISLFVLLFGLMGVAAIFPVGNHYAGKAEIYDRGAVLTDQAFATIKARGILNPHAWLYTDQITLANGSLLSSREVRRLVIQPQKPNFPTPGAFTSVAATSTDWGPGHAFVFDPLGVAASQLPRYSDPAIAGSDVFPFGAGDNPWQNLAASLVSLPGRRWPIRRVTLTTDLATPYIPILMTPAFAGVIAQLHDDLSNEEPASDDRPGIARWQSQVVDAQDDPGKFDPSDPATAQYANDQPLARAFAGNYSWLATVVPAGWSSSAFQPISPDYRSALFDVSVVIFHKRDATPSVESERLLEIEFAPFRSHLIAYADTPEEVDAAVRDIQQNQWVALTGVRPNGQLLLKWYKLQFMDDETQAVTVTPGNRFGRALGLDGPEWPSDVNADMRLILLPGVVAVSTQTLPLEQ